MQHGRDHDERLQKNGTRLDEELHRNSGDDEEVTELDRRARSTDPAPTQKAVEQERARHAQQGTRGGNTDDKKAG
jgi:hypothetical protein